MTTINIDSIRKVDARVTIECPSWCTSDHDGALGFDDLWHERELVRVDDENHVSLTLAAIDTATTGNWAPEVFIVLDGDTVERPGQRGARWSADDLRRLAAMCTRAADALEAVEA